MSTIYATPPSSTRIKVVPPTESTSGVIIWSEILDEPEVSSTRANDHSRYSLTKLISNKKILNGLLSLKANWNYNGAEPFDEKLIEICINIISGLEYQPKIFPTGRNSVQFEYEKENGDYLELEIFNDRIALLSEVDGVEKESLIPTYNSEMLNTIIRSFYAS